MSAALYDQHARNDFTLLPLDQQVGTIRAWAREGCSDHEIAARTRLHVEMIRRLLAPQSDARAWEQRNA